MVKSLESSLLVRSSSAEKSRRGGKCTSFFYFIATTISQIPDFYGTFEDALPDGIIQAN